MAIYHMSAQVISRSSGRSATAAAAYRAGEKIVDERTGEVHDYTRKGGVDHKEIITPENAGTWATDRSNLWNTAEQSENRKNSQVAREINVAIPVELEAEKGRELVREYAKENFVKQGMIADICIHGEKTENPHAHILLTMRVAGPEGFTSKNRDWNDREQLERWREDWAHSCNKMFEREGLNISIDHRTLEAQGVKREPTKHLGPSASEIEKRGGISELGEYNREIAANRQEIIELIKEYRQLSMMIAHIEKTEEKETAQSEAVPKAEPEAPQEQKSDRREYTDHTTQRIISYIQNEPDFSKVQQLYFLVRNDCIIRDIQDEIKKHPEYTNQAECKNLADKAHDSAISDERNIVAKIGKLGAIERTRYKFGKHELCQEEKEAKERKEKAYIEAMKAQRKLQEIEITLSGSTSDISREVTAHNLRAHKAQETYKQITPYFIERSAHEAERKRPQDKERGFER